MKWVPNAAAMSARQPASLIPPNCWSDFGGIWYFGSTPRVAGGRLKLVSISCGITADSLLLRVNVKSYSTDFLKKNGTTHGKLLHELRYTFNYALLLSWNTLIPRIFNEVHETIIYNWLKCDWVYNNNIVTAIKGHKTQCRCWPSGL